MTQCRRGQGMGYGRGFGAKALGQGGRGLCRQLGQTMTVTPPSGPRYGLRADVSVPDSTVVTPSGGLGRGARGRRGGYGWAGQGGRGTVNPNP